MISSDHPHCRYHKTEDAPKATMKEGGCRAPFAPREGMRREHVAKNKEQVEWENGQAAGRL
jgi:hypothetical protein